MRFRGREMGMDFVIEQEQDPDDHVTGLQPPPSQMDVSGSSEGGNLAPHETQDEGEDELANQEPAPDADEDDDKENNFYKGACFSKYTPKSWFLKQFHWIFIHL